MKKALWLTCVVAGLGLTSCQTPVGKYFADRGRDTLDMLPMSASTGPGGYAGFRATSFLGTGVGWTDVKRGGWGARRDIPGEAIEETLASPRAEWHEQQRGYFALWNRDADPEPGAGNAFFVMPMREFDAPQNTLNLETALDFEAEMHVGIFGLRMGVSPVQIADWLAGWFMVDFLHDDLEARKDKGEGSADEPATK